MWLIAIRILIADDSAPVRGCWRRIIERNLAWEICGEAVNGREAVELAKQLAPDLVVLDFSMPVMNGIEAAEQIAKHKPGIPLLLCTMHDPALLAQQVKNKGISGLICKSSEAKLTDAIHALLRREQFFPDCAFSPSEYGVEVGKPH